MYGKRFRDQNILQKFRDQKIIGSKVSGIKIILGVDRDKISSGLKHPWTFHGYHIVYRFRINTSLDVSGIKHPRTLQDQNITGRSDYWTF
jgi:hypothetical protein